MAKRINRRPKEHELNPKLNLTFCGKDPQGLKLTSDKKITNCMMCLEGYNWLELEDYLIRSNAPINENFRRSLLKYKGIEEDKKSINYQEKEE